MKKLRTLLITTILGLLVATGTSAEPETRYILQDEVVVPGRVDTVLTGEHLVRLRTPYGAKVEVPMNNLEMFAGNEAGYLELEPDQYVQARFPEGLLGVKPADKGMVWVLLDNEQVVKVYPKDIRSELFLDDENEIEINGRQRDVKVSELLIEQVKDQRLW